MRLAIVVLLAMVAPAFAGKPVPSGPLKAYKGPEGELVVMVEANDGKQMLVHFKNLDGELDGKTLLYDFEDHGDHGKTVFITKKRGSKTYRSIMLTELDGQWDFYHPTKPTKHFSLKYSEDASGKLKIDDVVNAYKP